MSADQMGETRLVALKKFYRAQHYELSACIKHWEGTVENHTV